MSVCPFSLVQVGCFLKTPRFPIWVVCSESHFSVLFSLQPELLQDWRAERLFDLYYYDGLANQQEQIRLTIGVPPPRPSPRLLGEPPHWARTPAPDAPAQGSPRTLQAHWSVGPGGLRGRGSAGPPAGVGARAV